MLGKAGDGRVNYDSETQSLVMQIAWLSTAGIKIHVFPTLQFDNIY